ncbi:MAG: hotdog domain-containing protein [Ornithinimicrobium sp.]
MSEPTPSTSEGDTPSVIDAMAPARVGMQVRHRRYVSYDHAHYAGNLVDGAYGVALFGDVATEMCVRTDGDEGLFASYSTIEFLAPILAGDCIDVSATLVRVGRRSREMTFALHVTARGNPGRGASAADLLTPPLLAVTARGVVVVPAD